MGISGAPARVAEPNCQDKLVTYESKKIWLWRSLRTPTVGTPTSCKPIPNVRLFCGRTWRFDCILPIKREEKSPQIPYFFQLYSIQNYNRLWYTGQVHSIYNYHLTTFFRCITLAVYLPTISESNAWGFRPVRAGISEHSRRFSEDFQKFPKISEDVPTTFSMTTF